MEDKRRGRGEQGSGGHGMGFSGEGLFHFPEVYLMLARRARAAWKHLSRKERKGEKDRQ